MKTLFIALILFAGLALSPAHAQLFSKKMPVGVKTYSFFDKNTSFEMEFKDIKGSLDKYNFYDLDSTAKAQNLTIVLDRKGNYWRLPLSLNEAMGISEKDGENPLQTLVVPMTKISPAIREKIE